MYGTTASGNIDSAREWIEDEVSSSRKRWITRRRLWLNYQFHEMITPTDSGAAGVGFTKAGNAKDIIRQLVQFNSTLTRWLIVLAILVLLVELSKA